MNNEELVLRIQQGEDIKKNMQQLYDQNYYLLRKTAKKYSNIDSMTDIDDLMQELYIPLYEATISYKSDNGATFITYALTCISRHLKRYLDDVGRVIRVPAVSYTHLFINITQMKYGECPMDMNYVWTKEFLESMDV